MLERAPNTQYVLSYSYGKDSGACIHVVKDILGWPLDRIVTADVWATQDIPAVLPEMWDWMQQADEEIYRRWGIRVEHFYATKKAEAPDVGAVPNTHTKTTSIPSQSGASTEMTSSGSQHIKAEDGAKNSKLIGSQSGRSKLTYEDIFYREMKPTSKAYKKFLGGVQRNREETDIRIPTAERQLVYGRTQGRCYTGSQCQYTEETGVPRSRPIYGFPHTGMRSGGQGWCHNLKTGFPQSPKHRGQR